MPPSVQSRADHDLKQDSPLRGPVDPRRIQQLEWDRLHKLPHHKDAEGRPEAGDDNAAQAIGESNICDPNVQRDEDHAERHHQRRQQDREQQIFPPEPVFGEHIAHRRRGQQCGDRHAHRRDQTVLCGIQEMRAGKDLAIAIQRPGVRQQILRTDQLLERFERGKDRPDERGQRQQRHRQRHHMHEALADKLAGGAASLARRSARATSVVLDRCMAYAP